MTVHISGTNQEIFDRVCAHLAQQGTPSLTAGLGGAYRNPDGLRCAIGCLLPDDAPWSRLDSGNDNDIIAHITHGLITADASEDLLSRLQAAHDGTGSAAWLRDRLESIAHDFHLSAAAVAQIVRWER